MLVVVTHWAVKSSCFMVGYRKTGPVLRAQMEMRLFGKP